jgi:hypothetical protein
MRCLFLFGLVAAALVATAGGGRADTEAEALLAKAIQAHGGEEALAGHKALRLKLKVVYEGANQFASNNEWLFAAPDKLKETAEGFSLGRRTVSVTATDGKATWSFANGQTQQLDGKFAEWYKDQAHLHQVMRLVPLKGKEYELKAAGETEVDGKTAVGLLVQTKGQKDITLFFDAESGLLVKVERKVIDSGGEEVKEERFYRDYPKKGDLPYAGKVLIKHDGKTVEYQEVRDAKFLQDADANEFRRR